MYQPDPSSGQPGGPLRPAAPAPVLAAVKLMYAAAAVITVTLIISATLIDSTKAALRKANPGLTAAQIRDLTTLITLAIISGLVLIGPTLTWLAGAAAVWLLWRPACSTFSTLQDLGRVPPAHPRAYGGSGRKVSRSGCGLSAARTRSGSVCPPIAARRAA
jgi:hypothetical protein